MVKLGIAVGILIALTFYLRWRSEAVPRGMSKKRGGDRSKYDRKPRRDIPKGPTIVCGLIFLFAGVAWGYYYFNYPGKIRKLKLAGSVRVEGRVSGIHQIRENHFPVITYEHEGKTYQFRSRKKDQGSNYAIGQEVTLYVKPSSPEQVVLDTLEETAAFHIISRIAPFILTIVGVLVLIQGIKMDTEGMDLPIN